MKQLQLIPHGGEGERRPAASVRQSSDPRWRGETVTAWWRVGLRPESHTAPLTPDEFNLSHIKNVLLSPPASHSVSPVATRFVSNPPTRSHFPFSGSYSVHR